MCPSHTIASTHHALDCIYTNIYAYIHKHKHKSICKNVYIRTYMKKCRFKCSCMNTHIYTYIHIHAHTHKSNLVCPSHGISEHNPCPLKLNGLTRCKIATVQRLWYWKFRPSGWYFRTHMNKRYICTCMRMWIYTSTHIRVCGCMYMHNYTRKIIHIVEHCVSFQLYIRICAYTYICNDRNMCRTKQT